MVTFLAMHSGGMQEPHAPAREPLQFAAGVMVPLVAASWNCGGPERGLRVPWSGLGWFCCVLE